MSALVEGSRIGPYRIVRRLGEGGMGEVFEAVHLTIERHVAIKVLHADNASRPDMVGRFFNEARAANLIDHPSIVQVADFGHTSEGIAYIVMELVRGEALSQRLRRGGLSVAQAVHIARSIASALRAAHDKNIVHRDLKPDNVMLVPDPERPGEERLKVLDFGIAKLMETEQAGPVKTRANLVMGTPDYMSPEQCRGSRDVDTKADVYSLGVILYEMLSGRLPFVAEDSGSLIGMHLFKEPPPLLSVAPHVPEPLAALADQLLRKDKERRPSMRELAAQLQQLTETGTPMPTATAGSWLTSLLRRVLPGRAKKSTLGPLAGQLDPRLSGGVPKRHATRAAGLVGLVALSGLGYLLAPVRHPVPAPIPKSAQGATPAVTPSPQPTVRWEIASDPSGAEVVRMPDGEILGTTPLAYEQPAQAGRVTLNLRLSGYQLAQFTMDQQTPGQVDKRLVPEASDLLSNPSLTRPRPRPPRVGAPPKSMESPHVWPRPKAHDLLEK